MAEFLWLCHEFSGMKDRTMYNVRSRPLTRADDFLLNATDATRTLAAPSRAGVHGVPLKYAAAVGNRYNAQCMKS